MSHAVFITIQELASDHGGLTPFAIQTLYTSHALGVGPLSSILQKWHGRVGCFRTDFEQEVQSLRRLAAPPVPRSARQLLAAG